MAYLHGIETITYKTGTRPVIEVKTAVVGIVGTAPPDKVPPFTLTVFSGEKDAKDKLGGKQDGYTVYDALKAIFDHENTIVLFVNTYDSNAEDPKNPPDESVLRAFGEFDKALFKYGFTPKIIIAPEFSVRPAVAVEMAARAKKYRGIAYVDLPNDIDINSILQYKQDHNLADTNTVLCYPKVKTVDGEDWLSSRLAGLTVWMDKNAPESYGAVPSNRRIEGIIGITKDLTYLPNDPDSDVQRINSQGVYTIRPFLGELVGFGVRTAAFPAKTHPADTLINWVRVSGIVEETLEYALLQYLDKIAFYSPEAPLEPVVKEIQSTIDDYLRTLEMRGITIYRSVKLDLERTTLTELLQGRIHYEYELVPGVPIEGIVLHKVMNSDRVREVLTQVAQKL